MPIFDRLRKLFSREAAEAKIFYEELRQRAEDDLGRRENALTESPAEALARAQAAAEAGDEEFARLEQTIGSRLSDAEVSALTEPAAEGEDQAVIDLNNFDHGGRDPLGMRSAPEPVSEPAMESNPNERTDASLLENGHADEDGAVTHGGRRAR